tara:strand:+ start:135 stop:725 length:591 start_codon:yes stop_codon:yes gene_type:complete
MKPRFEIVSSEVNEMLVKAKKIEDRISLLEKAEDCPKCKGGKLNKAGNCMKMGCGGKMAKAQPGFTPEKISDTDPRMVTETGGQTRTAPYTTNGKTIEVEDVKNPKAKKKDKSQVNVEALSDRLNPHSGTGADREDAAGEAKPLKLNKANPSAQHREALESGVGGQCATCGGSYGSGCRIHAGMDINACPQYSPVQ